MNNIRYSIIGEFLEIIKSGYRKHKWHILHPDSDTIPMNSFDFNHVTVGKYTYGELNVVDFGGDCKLILGDFISIAQGVTFILNAEHYIDHISTYPFKVKMLACQKSESFGKGDIVIDEDVWIGYGAIILSGVHVARGAVIAAGAVVTKDVPAYSVVGGNPAKVIKMRFGKEVVDQLMRIDYQCFNIDFVSDHIEMFYTHLSEPSQLEEMDV